MTQCSFMRNDKGHEKKKAFEKGVDLFERGNLEKAIEKFDEAISLDYLDVPSHLFRAKALLMLADYEGVEKELKELESIRPNDPNLLIFKIWYYNTIEDYDSALRESEYAVRLYPRNGEIRFQRALVFENMNNYEEALNEINLAINLDNTDPDFYQKKGDILAAMNNREEALRSYDIAINMDIKNSFRYIGKATAFAMFKDYENALKFYDLAIAANPEDVDAHHGRYITLKKLKNHSAALQELDNLENLDDVIDVIKERATLLILSGRFQEAYNLIINGANSNDESLILYGKEVLHNVDDIDAILKFLDSMIMLMPDNLDLKHLKISELIDLGMIDEADQFLESLEHDDFYYHYQKALILNLNDEYEKALVEYDKTLSYQPDDDLCAFVHTLKGSVFMIIKQYENAIAEFDKAIKLMPYNPEPKLAKIEAFKTMKNYASALELTNELISKYPDNEDLAYNRIFILKELERYDEALKYCDAMIKKASNFLDLYQLKFEIYEKMKRFDDALKQVDYLITEDPKEPAWYLNKAEILEKMQRYKDAEQEYDRAIKIDTSSLSYIAKFFFYIRLNELDKAKKLVDEAFKKYPDDQNVDFAEVVLLERTGTIEKALETCSTHLIAHPDSLGLNVIYAILLTKNKMSGIEHLEHALSSKVIDKIDLCEFLSEIMNMEYFSEEDKNNMKNMSERFCT
ncbi:MAG: tetratricopeptide repeat protein [Thermoplasmata archaeon]